MSRRISANLIRKSYPSLKRINTPEGRRWTLDGKKMFVSLAEFLTWDEEKRMRKTDLPLEVLPVQEPT